MLSVGLTVRAICRSSCRLAVMERTAGRSSLAMARVCRQ